MSKDESRKERKIDRNSEVKTERHKKEKQNLKKDKKTKENRERRKANGKK